MKLIEDILDNLGVKWHHEESFGVKSYYCTTDTRNPTSFFIKYNEKLDHSSIGFECFYENNVKTENIRGSILANI